MYLFPGLVGCFTNELKLNISCAILYYALHFLCNLSFYSSIGLGTLLSGSRIVSDGMLQAAAERYVEVDSIVSENMAIVNQCITCKPKYTYLKRENVHKFY